MNKQELDIIKYLYLNPYTNQRHIAEETSYSIGLVNRCINNLFSKKYINFENELTDIALEYIQSHKPERAVILAAGFGMRMVPINTETPKALIKVKGEVLIERLIHQLHEVGINEIYVVAGFMKEQFEYLIDDFNIHLIINKNYASSNNLYSLNLVRDKLKNAYILPCDIWCEQNPFNKEELYSWYMVKDSESLKSEVRINRKQELIRIKKGLPGNPMLGISYISREDADILEKNITDLCRNSDNEQAFWEEALYENGKMFIWPRLFPADKAIEINTYEQLREFDSSSGHLKNDAITAICSSLICRESEIKNITTLKKGMTNRSFLFSCKNKNYIMRIPGEGTDKLINRRQEAEVFNKISPYGFCDNPVYINPENGYKITSFLDGVRNCDPDSVEDLEKCMSLLRRFHDCNIKLEHSFDIFEHIDFYESLWNGSPSAYRDYAETKNNVFSLKKYIEKHIERICLTHVDAVPDNFLFYRDEKGNEQLQLTDWEYAGMQDPHVDIAMFCIYSMYDREQVDRLIDIYFEGNCPKSTRVKIYCYIAACGLLWSNWCEYKRNLGVEFGEYSIKQYRFAKEYYRIAREEMKNV